jgi:hypothetical protein
MADTTLRILNEVGIPVNNCQEVALSGGVSSETLLVSYEGGMVVVKRALKQLRVARHWESSPSRIFAEAEGLEWFHRITPEYVPLPIGVSREFFGLVLPVAPQPSADLRDILLDNPQKVPERVGQTLAEILVRWHNTPPEGAQSGELNDLKRLRELRVEPFYIGMGNNWPDFQAVYTDLASELMETPLAVVHGDFTPKNILCLPDDGLWVIDTEVAHIGHPVLDTASMLAHLTLKTLLWKESDHGVAMADIWRDFFTVIQQSSVSSPPSLSRHVGAIMSVRLDGIAPVSYLDNTTITKGVHLAQALLDGQTLAELGESWSKK